MINGVFLHMKGDDACKREVGKKHQVSLSIHDPCPLPSRKSHFIARWTIAPLNFLPFSTSILHANCPIHFAVMTFYKHFHWNGCSCIIIFMRHFPVPLIRQHFVFRTREGVLNAIFHAIYMAWCGLWCTKSNSTARKIYIMWNSYEKRTNIFRQHLPRD